jgi:hypothetical protein
MTLCILALGITTLSNMTLITKDSFLTLSITALFIKFMLNVIKPSVASYCYAECNYTEYLVVLNVVGVTAMVYFFKVCLSH